MVGKREELRGAMRMTGSFGGHVIRETRMKGKAEGEDKRKSMWMNW